MATRKIAVIRIRAGKKRTGECRLKTEPGAHFNRSSQKSGSSMSLVEWITATSRVLPNITPVLRRLCQWLSDGTRILAKACPNVWFCKTPGLFAGILQPRRPITVHGSPPFIPLRALELLGVPSAVGAAKAIDLQACHASWRHGGPLCGNAVIHTSSREPGTSL